MPIIIFSLENSSDIPHILLLEQNNFLVYIKPQRKLNDYFQIVKEHQNRERHIATLTLRSYYHKSLRNNKEISC